MMKTWNSNALFLPSNINHDAEYFWQFVSYQYFSPTQHQEMNNITLLYKVNIRISNKEIFWNLYDWSRKFVSSFVIFWNLSMMSSSETPINFSLSMLKTLKLSSVLVPYFFEAKNEDDARHWKISRNCSLSLEK